MAPKIVLHHLEASRSDRMFWLLEELGLDYEVKAYARMPTRAAPPELRKTTPYGKAPAVELDGRCLMESGFIIHKLITSFPNDAVEREASDDSLFWSHFSEGSLMMQLQMGISVAITTGAVAHGQMPGVEMSEDGRKGVGQYGKILMGAMVMPNVNNYLEQVDTFLGSNEFFSGNDKPGEGDFQMFFPINSLLAGSREDMGFKVGPNTKKWWERVTARPACQKGLERLKREEEAQISAKSKI